MANPFVNQSALTERIAGMRAAKAAFNALPEVTRDRLNHATETTVREIVRFARNRLLASPSIQTRSLYNAVQWTMNPKNGRGKVGIADVTTTLTVGGTKIRVRGIVRAGAGGSARTAQDAVTKVPRTYGPKVEFGTRRMKAEPFMGPAVQDQKQPYLDRCLARGADIERDLAAIGARVT